MSTFWTITSVALIAVALWLTIRPYIPAAVAAYAAMWTLRLGGVIHPSTWMLASWGAVAAIVLIIDTMQPRPLARATNGLPYMSTGALVGTAVGLITVSYVWTLLGAAAGAVMASMAYSRTPAGRSLDFPSQRFFSYTLAKCLPLIAAYGIMGAIGVMTIMNRAPEYSLRIIQP